MKGAESTIKKGDTLVNKGESLLKKAEELEKSLGNSVGKRDDDQSDRRGVQVSEHRLAQEVDRTRARFMEFIEITERGKKKGGGRMPMRVIRTAVRFTYLINSEEFVDSCNWK